MPADGAGSYFSCVLFASGFRFDTVSLRILRAIWLPVLSGDVLILHTVLLWYSVYHEVGPTENKRVVFAVEPDIFQRWRHALRGCH